MLKYNNSGMLDGFIDHRGNMILSNNDYDTRKSVCDILYNIYKSDDFVWSNQSFTSLSISLFKQLCGYIEESVYNTQAREIIDTYYPKALQWVNTDYEIADEDVPKIISIDISKCYPSTLLNNKTKIPIYSIHDCVEEFDLENDLILNNAEYAIDEYIVSLYGANIKIESAFYSSDLIEYLLSLGMPRTQIKYKIVTKRCLKADTYSHFIKYIFDNFPEKTAKILTNSFIGHLGRKYKRLDRGFICTEYETALCCWTQALSEGNNLSINKYNDTYLLKEQKCERLFQDNTSINRFVVSQSILKTLKLINKCCDDQSKLISINTDGFNVLNPRILFKHKKDVQFDTSHIGKPFVTEANYSYIEKHYRPNIDISEFESIQGNGVIYNGVPGSGKTMTLCELVMKCKNPIVLSFTNKAIENCKNRLTNNGYTDVKKICHTLDSFFATNTIESLMDKTVFIEEFSMIPCRFMNMIYNAFTKYDITIYLFGDKNQTSPVENNTSIIYDYTQSFAIRQMCPKLITLKYIEGTSRYDKNMNNLLSRNLKIGKIKHKFKAIDNTIMKHICYLNKTRKRVNTICCDQFSKGKEYHELEFKYNDKFETYKICKDMPVLATQNLKDHCIFNMMEFKIMDIDDNKFLINDIWFDKEVFTSSFIPCYCNTIYKYQGCSIDQKYAIHDTERMCKKQLYTALSRTTKLEYIHLDNSKLNRSYKTRPGPSIEIINSRFNSIYKNGKIYKITFDNGNVYVGQTCESLETRLRWHLSNKNSQIYIFRINMPVISLITNAPSFDKKSLEIVETKYIHEFSEKYGKNLLNKRMNPIKKRKEIKYFVNLETEEALRERISSLENKIKIIDDDKNKCLYYNTRINNITHRFKSRYSTKPKEDAIKCINKSKNELIKKLTIDLD